MEDNFKVVHRAGRAHSNMDPLSRNPVATLPWEAAASDLEDFPEYAAPEFGDGLNPPSHSTIRMVLLNRDVDSSEGIEDNPASPGRQNLPEGQELEEEGEGDTPNYLLMAPSKLPEEHTLRPEDTRFWKWIDPRKLFPDQEKESEEEWVEACENAPWEVSSGNEPEEDTPKKADDYKSTAGAEERRGPIVMMVKGGEEIPGPPELDLETESAAQGKVRIPDLNDLSLAEILDHDWDDQLGWNPERTLEAGNRDEPAEVHPQAVKGLEALTVDEIGEI
jgi:hypothetical protein